MQHTTARASLITLVIGVAVLLLFVIATQQASAIPAFARRYQTSCATCHNNYPELNDFGEAFKKNGFKFPKDDDAFVKEPPVLLGAPAYKKVFPKAIYPGEIPGSIPIGFRYSGNFNYTSKQPPAIAAAGFVPRTDLFAPNTFTIIGAGSLGQRLSFWVDDDISSGGSGADGGLGDGYLKINDVGHYLHLPKDALNVRFGQFELDLPFTQARGINLTGYDVYSQLNACPTNGSPCTANPDTPRNPFSFDTDQRGIEFGGYPNDGNFSWSVALVNGANDAPATRSSKDVYVRVSQRFNLERDASVRKEVQAAGATGPRDHSSIRFGAFYYYGRNERNQAGDLFPGLGTLREPFFRTGGDFRFRYRNFELYGMGMYGRDQNLVENGDDPPTGFVLATPVTFSGGFGQANYWVYPWMIALMRYDIVNSSSDFLSGVSRNQSRNRFSPGIQFLVRANIKLALEYQHQWEQPIPDSTQFFRPNGFVSGIDFVF
jgi:hypothetical protein